MGRLGHQENCPTDLGAARIHEVVAKRCGARALFGVVRRAPPAPHVFWWSLPLKLISSDNIFTLCISLFNYLILCNSERKLLMMAIVDNCHNLSPISINLPKILFRGVNQSCDVPS